MSNTLNIEQFSLSSKKMKSFIHFPYQLHQRQAYWIPQLRMQAKDNFHPTKNPFWKFAQHQFFLVYQNDKVVGRIAAIIHPKYNEFHQSKTGFFGFLEAVDDQNVFNTLLTAATNWIKSQGMTRVLGPFNPSLNYELGILINGFTQYPTFLMPYHPPYYDEKILQSSFQKILDFYAYQLDVVDFQFTPRLVKINKWLKKRHNITFQNLDFKDIPTDAAKVHEIYNEAFQHHWGYTPFDLEEVIYMAHELKAIVEKDFFFFIYVNDKIAGFILAIPDLNEAVRYVKNGRIFPFGIFQLLYRSRSIKRVRVLNAAVKDQYRHLGLSAILYEELKSRLNKKGYLGAELSWVAENNLNMNNGAKEIGGHITKKYRIYEQTIT
jgi:ribosomal protein S18 acetylase RimI-like enzyme